LSNYHAGEMPYAYGNLWRKAKLYDEADFEVSRLMQSYWVNFVKTGDPNGEGLPRWDAREEGSELLMEFCEEPKMTEDPYLAIYEILDKYQDEAAEKTE
ncbi:MAG: carboxylesterase family protein, partial [Oscillospiraceae bacterium]|nr:carboxylesterase family protein [Oscillospiraceae bacterium]